MKAAEPFIPSFARLRPSASPAFVLLGVSPDQIQRPTTPSQIAVSLAALVSDHNDVTLPKNLAVEFAPYWLFAHPDLDLDKLEADSTRGWYRNVTVSLGTAAITNGNQASTAASFGNTDLAVGVKTRILDGKTPSSCREQIEALRKAAADAAKKLLVPSDDLAALAQAHPVGTPEFDAAIETYKTDVIARAVKLPQLSDRCISQTAARMGLLLDVAGAMAVRFPDGSFSQGRLQSGAAWVALGYGIPRGTALALARYWRQRSSASDQHFLDTGGRFIYTGNDYALSIEGLYRRVLSDAAERDLYRLSLVVEYELRSETWVSVVFGKDFYGSQAGSLFSLANLSWGFGKRTLK